jgi:WD40 repeat protein
MLASVGEDGFIKIWDSTDGQELQTLGTGAGAELFSVDFGPEGRLLVTGAGNGEVVIWDLEQTGRRLTVSQLPGIAWSVEFSPDGSTLAVGMAEPNSSPLDGKVSVFLLDVDDLVDLALSRLTRWWTLEECQIYLHTDVCPERPTELLAVDN